MRNGKKIAGNIGKRIFLALVLIFLYIPIAVLVVLSFNSSKSMTNWGGFTTHWYADVVQNEDIMTALFNTLSIAILAAIIATVLGTIASIALCNFKKKPRSVIMGFSNVPMLNAEIVTGIGFLLLFTIFGIALSFVTVLIGHIAFCVPYVVLSVMPKLKQLNNMTYEAALDLGASPLRAFFKVVLPDILPGIISGLLLSFTLSLDDFVITYFAKGRGFNTLSTLIYAETKRGIRPEIYALSTILFAIVFILLLLTNLPRKKKIFTDKFKTNIKRFLSLVTIAAFVFGLLCLSGCEETPNDEEAVAEGDNVLYVYNWDDYIDENVVEMFEEETGIKVIYDVFETNESLYAKLASGDIAYDVLCPSDYMIAKMIANDMLAKIDYDSMENFKYIGKQFMETSRAFDPTLEYSVPYTWGTVGILYNTKMVDEDEVHSWNILFNEKYEHNIVMLDSVRDSFCVAQKLLGYSLNTLDPEELEESKELLCKQKPILQAYEIDFARERMINESAALAVIYSGEALYSQSENEDLEYVVPDEGSNIFIDSWVIPANAEHKEAAHKWIDFLCRPDIATMNLEYLTYSTPNTAVYDLLEDEELKASTTLFPDDSVAKRCEAFSYLGEDGDAYYNTLWEDVKAASNMK